MGGLGQFNNRYDSNGNLNVNVQAGGGSSGFVQIQDGIGGVNLAQVTAAHALKVDGSAVTQPTEDLADAIIGSPTVADVIQIGYADAGGNAQIPSSAHPLPVTVISGGGGGTQYTDETAESAGAFTGTVAMLYNGTDVVGLRGDSSNNLYVNLDTAIPAGANTIGAVTQASGPWTVASTGVATNAAAAWTSSTTANTAITPISNNYGYSLMLVQFTSSAAVTGSGTVAFEGSVDNSAWNSLPYYVNANSPTPTINNLATNTVTGITFMVYVNVTGYPYVRIRLNSQFTGTATLTIGYSLETLVESPIQTIQGAVTGTGNFNVVQGSAAALLATVSIAAAQTLSTVTTVSTVTAVTAITNALPAGTNLLGSVKLSDGTNVETVKAASTAAVGTDTAAVVALHPLSQPQVIGYMMDSTGVQRAITQVAFTSSSSGAHSLVALSAGKSIYILSWWVSNGATANAVNLQSHTTTGTTTGVVNMAINGGAVFPPNNGTWITGVSGEAIDFNLTGSSQVNGGATYCQF